MADNENGAGEGAANHVELYIKAGRDGESIGGCPLCQRVFMVLLVKAGGGELSCRVTTVNSAKPPEHIAKFVSRLPCLVHGDTIISDVDEIIAYVDSHFPYPPMAFDNARAAKACQDVFSKFTFYLKDVSRSPALLIAELQKMNSYLEEEPHRFLTRDNTPDHLDCAMLPKLQHIRVVSHIWKGFEMPHELTALWRYLDTCYNSDFFRQTCPSDQEIIHHWMNKPELGRLPKSAEALLNVGVPPKYSFDVPSGH